MEHSYLLAQIGGVMFIVGALVDSWWLIIASIVVLGLHGWLF